MWTWKFELSDILTTLSIVVLIGGVIYNLFILPILTRIGDERMQDNLLFNERMNTLNETLVELKEEIKLSRVQRTKAYTTAILNAHNADVNAHKPLMDMIARVSIKVTSWEAFRRLCRAGCIREHYGVGDQLQCHKGDMTLTWDIVHIGELS